MLFMNGLYFALRSGQEHRQLRFNPCQIRLHERQGEKPYLEYTEDVSKNRPGGLKNRKTKPKVVVHYSNEENPERCFVRLFKLYTSLCPQQSPKNSFYLQPLKKPQPNCWYSTKPIGHNTLEGTVARLCKNAGIQGYHTNHSLRATTATRLFQAGVDEQLIMEKTGHTSLDGVRSYKRTSSTQQQCLSDILNTNSKSVISDLQSADKLALVPSISLDLKMERTMEVHLCAILTTNLITHLPCMLISLHLLTFIHALLSTITMAINPCKYKLFIIVNILC